MSILAILSTRFFSLLFSISYHLSLFYGCASIYHLDSTKSANISYSETILGSQKWKDFGKVISEGKEIIIKIEKGQSVPLNLIMNLPMATLEPTKSNLKFTQDTYLLISKTKFQISADGQKWANIYDVNSQKRLFGFSKGNVSINFQGKDDGSAFTVDVWTKTNQK